jgi:hypothetical protein
MAKKKKEDLIKATYLIFSNPDSREDREKSSAKNGPDRNICTDRKTPKTKKLRIIKVKKILGNLRFFPKL